MYERQVPDTDGTWLSGPGVPEADAVDVLRFLFIGAGLPSIPMRIRLELQLLFAAAQFHLRARAALREGPGDAEGWRLLLAEPHDVPGLIATFERLLDAVDPPVLPNTLDARIDAYLFNRSVMRLTTNVLGKYTKWGVISCAGPHQMREGICKAIVYLRAYEAAKEERALRTNHLLGAFGMGLHPRLGARSGVRWMTPELVMGPVADAIAPWEHKTPAVYSFFF